jgi:hypothetical protein
MKGEGVNCRKYATEMKNEQDNRQLLLIFMLFICIYQKIFVILHRKMKENRNYAINPSCKRIGFAWRKAKRLSILNHLTDMNLIWINSAKYLGDYRLSLSFSNGEQRVFDAKDFIASHPLFAPLQDKQLFSQFQLDGWTISWQNGTLDIAPEYLYEVGTAA